jgi:hypothetical protein
MPYKVPWRFEPPEAVVRLKLGNGYTDECLRKTQLSDEEMGTVDWLFDFCDKAALELYIKQEKIFDYDGKSYCLKRVFECIRNTTESLLEQIVKRHSTIYKNGL